MQETTTLGLVMLIGLCGAPFFFGAAVGWWFSDRVRRYGVLGAFLPGWLRERI
jgi:hypothetical protein